jgi:hypothetical protein
MASPLGLAILAGPFVGSCGSKTDSTSKSAAASGTASASASQTGSASSSGSARPDGSASASGSAAAASAKEIDLTQLLTKDDPTAAKIGGFKLDPVDTSKVPSLGGGAKSEPIKDASWLPLPGGTTEIRDPKDWSRKLVDADKGYLLSPDKKSFVLFTTFENEKEFVSKADATGQSVKLTNVVFRYHYKVKVGEDSLPAHLLIGDGTVPSGKAGAVVLAVETGVSKKVLAIGIYEADIPPKTREMTNAILGSIRKKR